MKKIIVLVMRFIEYIYVAIQRAYLDTYSDEILAEDLKQRIEELQEINKAKYIGFAAGVYTNEAAKKGMYLPTSSAVRMAEKSFIDNLLADKLDELNNIKGEGNESNY